MSFFAYDLFWMSLTRYILLVRVLKLEYMDLPQEYLITLKLYNVYLHMFILIGGRCICIFQILKRVNEPREGENHCAIKGSFFSQKYLFFFFKEIVIFIISVHVKTKSDLVLNKFLRNFFNSLFFFFLLVGQCSCPDSPGNLLTN